MMTLGLATIGVLACGAAVADVTLRTDYVDLVIDDAGRWKSFFDRTDKQELLGEGAQQPIMWVRLPTGEVGATAATLAGDRLTVQFAGRAEAVLQVTKHPHYVAFELVSLRPEGADQVQLAGLLLQPTAEAAGAINTIYDDRRAAGLLALNLPVNCQLRSYNPASGTLEGVTQSFRLVEGDAPVGKAFGEYTATSTRPTGDGWAYRPKRLRSPLDLSAFAGLGVWVRGDGSRELLKVQLHDEIGEGIKAYKDHYITIDFTGWKYVELPRKSEDTIDYSHVMSVNLYYNGIPANTTATCGIDDLRAIRALTGKPPTDPADVVLEDFESASCEYLDRRGIELSATCYAKYGTVGSRFAIFGCPRAKLATVMQEIEKTEGLPCPQLSGKWGRLSPDIKRSYIMFHDLSEANVDRAIEYAKLANAGMIVLLESCWATSTGHFPINERNYSDGIASLKRTVQKINAAGLRAGLHFLACGITQNDAYITPVPDPRLLKDAAVTLAADIDEKATTVPCAEAPNALFPREDQGYEGDGVDVQIDDEIIRYGAIEGSQLVLCTRGAYGTTAAPHKAGAKVSHLRRHYGMFLRDVDSSINDEVADRIAYIVNECGFGMTYWDGSERLQGDHWYYNPKMQYAYWKRYRNRDTMLMQGSSYAHLSWHLHSRMASADGYRDIKRLLDERSPGFETGYKRNFIPLDIGWYGLGQERLTFDDIEYVSCRSIGYDSSIGWSTPVSALDNYPRSRELLEMCGRYEKLRLEGAFDEATQARLREPGKDYRLVQHGDRWVFVDARYDPPVEITDTDGKANVWSVPPSPLLKEGGQGGRAEVEIRVGDSIRPGANWDREDNLVLEDFTTLAPYAKEGNDYEKFVIGPGKMGAVKEGVTQRFELTADNSRTGQPVAKYEAVSALGDKSGWSAIGKRFPEPIDISWMAGIGLWVHGDGKGASFKVQLRDTAGGWNDHYIRMTYTGWRYHELVTPQSGELDRQHLAYLLFYFNGLPGNETSTVHIDTVKALRELSPPIRDISLTLGDAKVTFPGEFETGQTILYRGIENCELLTWGKGRQPIKAEGQEPTLAAGENQARVEVNGILTRALTVRTARVGR
ncbi:MAG: hypothetical protein FJX75_24255 [Armatimonadetes bacterium]|nr:hypothetical protein [Armatimonadota bacterium]